MKKKNKKSYRNQKWFKYSNSIKKRDNFTCLKCNRSASEAILQTHHTTYKANLKPWEYPKSKCVTLCKGCHAREHNLIQPNSGWTLISIEDLGDLAGVCERKGCGTEIRYSHEIYHPKWGYLSVGSSCVDFLTKEDQSISNKTLKIHTKIRNFANNSEWRNGTTKNGADYIESEFSYNKIRIYGTPNDYAFQIVIKEKGKNGTIIKILNKFPIKIF